MEQSVSFRSNVISHPDRDRGLTTAVELRGGRGLRLSLSGEFTTDDGARVGGMVAGAAAVVDDAEVVIDISELSFGDVDAFSAFTSMAAEIAASGRQLVFTDPMPGPQYVATNQGGRPAASPDEAQAPTGAGRDRRGRIEPEFASALVHRLSAAAFTLTAVESVIKNEHVAKKLEGVIDEIDALIRDIGSSCASGPGRPY